jgi:hypothetical protein
MLCVRRTFEDHTVVRAVVEVNDRSQESHKLELVCSRRNKHQQQWYGECQHFPCRKHEAKVLARDKRRAAPIGLLPSELGSLLSYHPAPRYFYRLHSPLRLVKVQILGRVKHRAAESVCAWSGLETGDQPDDGKGGLKTRKSTHGILSTK